MPDWKHTHDLHSRGRTYPVMSKIYMGLQLMFRADGAVEWIRHPSGGWALRGQLRQDVALESVIYAPGKEINPRELELLPPAPAALKAAE